MLAFTCGNCGQLLFYENSVCLRCQSPCGFVPSRLDLVTLSDPDGSGEGFAPLPERRTGRLQLDGRGRRS